MQACTGYASYETDPDTLVISVNGSVPYWPVGSAWEARVKKGIDRWLAPSQSACAATGMPLTWFFGIMAAESGGDPAACSPPTGSCGGRCCAYGLMQFIDSTARCYGKVSGEDLIANPELALDLSAKFFGDRIDGTNSSGCYSGHAFGLDLPRLAAAYNAGSARCSGDGTFGLFDQSDYAMRVVRSANTAYRLGVTPWPVASRSLMKVVGAGLMAVGGIAAAVILWPR